MEYSEDAPSKLHMLSMQKTGNKNEIYNKWATTYDNYVKSFEYCGPRELVELISMHHFFENKTEITVLDFGCGTGLLGEEFNKKHLDNCKLNMTGVDISENMISKCSERNVYDNLVCRDILKDESEKDILDKLGVEDEFDLLISCGVFLEGHVDLWEVNKILINLVKEQGGIIAFTVRNSFLEETPEFFMSLFDNPKIRIIAKVKIAYLKGVDAWAIILKRI
jgi:predicted TPR repeat methyltransferase